MTFMCIIINLLSRLLQIFVHTIVLEYKDEIPQKRSEEQRGQSETKLKRWR